MNVFSNLFSPPTCFFSFFRHCLGLVLVPLRVLDVCPFCFRRAEWEEQGLTVDALARSMKEHRACQRMQEDWLEAVTDLQKGLHPQPSAPPSAPPGEPAWQRLDCLGRVRQKAIAHEEKKGVTYV